MNVKFRKIPGKKKFSSRQSIDATKIMEKYSDYKFGTCDFNSIRIAHIFATPDKDGFYKTLSEVHLDDCLCEPESNLEKPEECEKIKCCDDQNMPIHQTH